MTQPRNEPWSSKPLANTLPTICVYIYIYIYIHTHIVGRVFANGKYIHTYTIYVCMYKYIYIINGNLSIRILLDFIIKHADTLYRLEFFSLLM